MLPVTQHELVRVECRIKRTIVSFIDIGSTHTFIDGKMVSITFEKIFSWTGSIFCCQQVYHGVRRKDYGFKVTSDNHEVTCKFVVALVSVYMSLCAQWEFMSQTCLRWK